MVFWFCLVVDALLSHILCDVVLTHHVDACGSVLLARNEEIVMDESCDQLTHHDTTMRSQQTQTDARLETGLPEPQFCSLPIYTGRIICQICFDSMQKKHRKGRRKFDKLSNYRKFVFCQKMGKDRSQVQQSFKHGRLEIYRGKMGTQGMQKKIFQRALLGVTKSDI